MKIDIKQGSLNLAKLFSLLIVTYIFFSTIIFIIGLCEDLEVPKDLLKSNFDRENKKIIAIVTPLRPGEKQQAIMISKAARKMGHYTYVLGINDQDMKVFLPTRYLNELTLYILNKYIKPDLHLAMSFHANIDLPSPKIMYISIPPEYFTKKVKKYYPEVNDYSNFIDINLINNSPDWISKALKRKVNRYYGIVGVPANEYKTSNHDRLILFGSLWGRKTDNLYSAIRKLSSENYMYFIKHPFLILEAEDNQKFAEDAKGIEALQKRLNEYGIGLCAHSNYHNKAGIPSSRIFEIISSGAVAISDMNPFVIKFFGDNVLYYDQTKSAEEIFKQINDHVQWLKDHPLGADEKARNAHKILQDHFTTEKFIIDLLTLKLDN